MKKKQLVLFTAEFPFGKGETYLEAEIKYLSQSFKSITIIPQSNKDNYQRTIPNNCTIKKINLELTKGRKVKSLINLMSRNVLNEIVILRKNYQLNLTFNRLKTILISYEVAKKVKTLVEGMMNEETTFYSYWSDNTAIGLALAKRDNPNIKAISRCHGWDVYFHVHPHNYLPFRTLISNQLNTIYPISNAGKNAIKTVWKANNDHIIVSHLGTLNNQPFEKRNKLKPFQIISCSNLIPLKRIHLIIDALKELKEEEIVWHHFGDGPLMNNLTTLVKDLPANIRVTFHGSVRNQDLMQFYAKTQPDLFINVSSSEGIPVSIMEAMSFGIPVLATNVGGTNEIVTNENGSLLPSSPKIEEIVDKIRYFYYLGNEAYYNYSLNAYQTWNLHFNADKNYSEFINQLI